jgi:hypothetical protein
MTTTEMLTARRELAAKKLADLGWEEGVSAGDKATLQEAQNAADAALKRAGVLL